MTEAILKSERGEGRTGLYDPGPRELLRIRANLVAFEGKAPVPFCATKTGIKRRRKAESKRKQHTY